MTLFNNSLVFITLVALSAKSAGLPPNIADYLVSKTLTEDNLLPSLQTDGKAFAEYVVSNKTQVLDNFTAIAPRTNQQKLVIAAMEFADGADYLAVLRRICDLKEANTISEDVCKFAIMATPIKKGFLSYNYQNASIRSLVQRAQTLLPGDTAFQTYLAAVLDGSQKTIDSRYFKVEELPEPELLP
jgi:hypothetical protein